MRCQQSEDVYPVAFSGFPMSNVVPSKLLSDLGGKVTEYVAHLIEVYCHWFVGKLVIVIRLMTIHSKVWGVFSFPYILLTTLVALN